MDKGFSEMKTTFDKSIYYPNEICHATAKINNKDCTIGVAHIKFCLKMELEIKTGSEFGAESFRKTYTYAESACTGPGPGVEDFKNEFAIDLSKIKYDIISEKKKKGEVRTVAPQN